MIRPGIRRVLRLPHPAGEVEEQELDSEIRLHLELRVEQLQREGLTAEEAREEALRRFGPAGESRRILRRAAERRERRMRARELFELVRQDVRFSLRSMWRSPGVTAVIVLSMALGIGLCTSMYSVVRSVILGPSPFPGADQLLSVEISKAGTSEIPLFDDFRSWSSEVSGVAELAGYAMGPRRVGNEQGTVEAYSVRVSERFFGVLGARPMLGRTLLPDDASPASAPVAVISHRLWRDLFGGDPSAVGRDVRVGERTYALVGVLEPGQEFPAPVEVWTPLAPAPEEVASLRVTVIGRLRPGSTPAQARHAIEAVHRPLAANRQPTEAAARAEILPLTGRQNEAAGMAALLLAISVGSILLIGIANAAGLILTRALGRNREIAIRAAMGASRLRIAALLLMEALLVALAAAGAGLLIAHLALVALQRAVPEAVSRQMLGWGQLGLDVHVAAFAVLLALISGAACAVVPAFGAARTNVTEVLQQNTPAATSGPRRRRVLRALIAGEVALSVVLLLCAALLSRSLLALVGQEPGFATEGVATVRWSLGGPSDAPPEKLLPLRQAMLARVAAIPGVESATLASELPATRAGFGATRTYSLEGADAAPGNAHWRPVSAGYLETLRIPVLQGRPFTAADDAEAPRVAVISESLARERGWNGETALGSQISAGGERWTIVGVAGDVHNPGARGGAAATIYVPHAQAALSNGYLVVRLAAPTGAVARPLREEIWRVDSSIAVGEVRPLQQVIDELLADQRIVSAVVAAYAATALVITLISLYTIVAHLVVRHRRESGIRAALGASPRRIVGSAMRRALAAAVTGTLIGVVLAAALARLIAGLLSGVTPLEPSVFGALPLLLIAVFTLAVYLPARAAARVDPIASLRT